MPNRRELLVRALAVSGLVFLPKPTFAAGNVARREQAMRLEMESLSVPGLSWALFADNKVRDVGVLGVKSTTTGEPITISTRFQAASLSKTINALCILTLARDGFLDLDDPVNRHLAGWRLGGHKDADDVTIRMLLSHSGGVNVSGFNGYARALPLPDLAAILDGIAPANSPRIRVQWKPGTRFAYSGGGITVLQKLVSDVTDLPYTVAIDRRVLVPLGMRNSSMLQPPQSTDLALGHDAVGKAVNGGYRHYPECAAAGLWTTASDMARAVCAIVNSLDNASDALLPPHIAAQITEPAFEAAGLGTFVSKAGQIAHAGANLGFRAIYNASLSRGRGYVVMSNGGNGEMLNDIVAGILIRDADWASN